MYKLKDPYDKKDIDFCYSNILTANLINDMQNADCATECKFVYYTYEHKLTTFPWTVQQALRAIKAKILYEYFNTICAETGNITEELSINY